MWYELQGLGIRPKRRHNSIFGIRRSMVTGAIKTSVGSGSDDEVS